MTITEIDLRLVELEGLLASENAEAEAARAVFKARIAPLIKERDALVRRRAALERVKGMSAEELAAMVEVLGAPALAPAAGPALLPPATVLDAEGGREA